MVNQSKQKKRKKNQTDDGGGIKPAYGSDFLKNQQREEEETRE